MNLITILKKKRIEWKFIEKIFIAQEYDLAVFFSFSSSKESGTFKY